MIVLVPAACAAYANSFSSPFIFDDDNSILENPTIRSLQSLGTVLLPPCNGETVSGRPVLNLSLAINYALGGTRPWGYHATNLAIHLLNGLLLWSILRRTFQLPVLRSRLGDASTALALAVALLWVLHPLQTESVTYIIQRAESLASLFYLLALYGVLRGSQSRRPVVWYVVAVVACWVGAASKEIVATAPVVVLLYDRTFLTGSFRESLRRRWGVYLGMAASWAVVAGLITMTSLLKQGTSTRVPSRWAYARSEPGVILYYLRLSIWPHPLCLDYGWPVANTWQAIVPGVLGVTAIVAAAWVGLKRRQGWGFCAAWFLLILSPTSSIVPLEQLAFEHRLYLPLAGIVALVVAGSYVGLQRMVSRGWLTNRAARIWGIGLIIVSAEILGFLTYRRNEVYCSEVSIWEDTAAKSPHNARALNNCAEMLSQNGRVSEAAVLLQEALRIQPDYFEAHCNLATVLASLGRIEEATKHYQEATRLQPDFAIGYSNWGNMLLELGRTQEAIEQYQRASRCEKADPAIWYNWGTALLRLGHWNEAIEQFEHTLRLRTDYAEAHDNLGVALAEVGRIAEAIQQYEAALRIKPDHAEAHYNLAIRLAQTGRTAEAIEHYRRALEINPFYAAAHTNWGNTLLDQGKRDEAAEHYRQALRIRPNDFMAHNNLGGVLSSTGRAEEALEHYRQALLAQPNDARIHFNLGTALASLGRVKESITHFDQAATFAPNDPIYQRTAAWLLATRDKSEGGDPVRAVKLAEQAHAMTGRRDLTYMDVLGAAYAAAGRFDEAMATANEARRLAEASGQGPLAQDIHMRLQLYRDHKPYRDPTGSKVPRRP